MLTVWWMMAGCIMLNTGHCKGHHNSYYYYNNYHCDYYDGENNPLSVAPIAGRISCSGGSSSESSLVLYADD